MIVLLRNNLDKKESYTTQKINFKKEKASTKDKKVYQKSSH
jgi:hypothetical protein